MKECVGGGGSWCVGGGGGARRLFRVCVFLSGEGEAGRGGWCKIYLLPSENFDPRVVNLSKESSQLNRKHEEEGKGGGGSGEVGEAGMFGGGGGCTHP